MWVADMDFQTAPAVIEATLRTAKRGVYGYSIVPDEYYDAVSSWWEKRHDFKIKKEWILFCTGVVPAISSVVRKMTEEGDNVLVQSPVYNIFYNSIINNNRKILSSDLCYDGESYYIDFDDLEMKLSDPKTTLMILCNPHNPVGKVWSRHTLKKIGDLCIKHKVLVLSDEIHCDLTFKGSYVPFASVSEEIAQNSISCVAPSKTFNIAGIKTSSIIVPNEEIRKKVDRAINTDEVAEPNVFAIDAAIAAFTKGGEWLDQLLNYLRINKSTVDDYVKNNIKEIKVVPSDATYLLWLDCSRITDNSIELCKFIRKETGLYLSEGAEYGGNGKYFLRMNIACPKANVEEGLKRLKLGIEKYINRK